MIEIDLNLLRIFDTLYELRSVTRTAAHLGLTQSAVSHSLRRLRETLDDPLFVRAAGELRPTSRAEEIANGVREGLVQLRSALTPSHFDPQTVSRRFTIATGSYFCALLIPRLLEHGRKIAPNIDFRVVALSQRLLAELDDNEVDLALGAFGKTPARLVAEPLYREKLVWIAAHGNPLADKDDFGPDSVPPGNLLRIMPARLFSDSRWPLDEGGGLERRAIAETGTFPHRGHEKVRSNTVYDAPTAIAIVARTDMVALVPQRFAQKSREGNPIRILRAEDESAGIDLTMLWHSKFAQDAGLVWLRSIIAALAR